jgi:PAS domain S-box-containing protein
MRRTRGQVTTDADRGSIEDLGASRRSPQARGRRDTERDVRVNWRSVAVHLADRATGSCALVDRELTVHLFSLGLERTLGWSRDEIEGRTWTEALVRPEQRAVAQSRLVRALDGTMPSFESVVVTKDGREVVLALESTLVGHEGAPGLLMTAVSHRTVPPPAPVDELRSEDVSYQVEVESSTFGMLHRLQSPRCPGDRTAVIRDHCYRVLHGRSEPCGDCPLLQPASSPWPRVATRKVPGAQELYEVVSATLSGERAQVYVQRIPGAFVSAIHEAKVDDLARTAQLSEREREVLRYLLIGRSLADIALILQISLRTVKFHQANVLEKLGVDSRSDLIRLIV